MISDGENGFLCDHLSEQDIASQMEKALAHTWNLSKIQSLPSLYTRENVIEKIFNLYQGAIIKK